MTLEELIARTEAEAPAATPLERLAGAARRQQDLTELGEQLLDHFVQQARSAGCSWAQVGTALGVSKQAAQQRHSSATRGLRSWLNDQIRGATGGLFTRFTREARSAVVAAQEEARRLHHGHLGTEHLLLGLLTGDTTTARALAAAGLDLDRGRALTVELRGPGRQESRGHIPFTTRAKRALGRSLHETRERNYIGPEHILLGLLSDDDSLAVRILTDAGIDRDQLRATISAQDT